jgi:hypothetical protein
MNHLQSHDFSHLPVAALHVVYGVLTQLHIFHLARAISAGVTVEMPITLTDGRLPQVTHLIVCGP